MMEPMSQLPDEARGAFVRRVQVRAGGLCVAGTGGGGEAGGDLYGRCRSGAGGFAHQGVAMTKRMGNGLCDAALHPAIFTIHEPVFVYLSRTVCCLMPKCPSLCSHLWCLCLHSHLWRLSLYSSDAAARHC